MSSPSVNSKAVKDADEHAATSADNNAGELCVRGGRLVHVTVDDEFLPDKYGVSIWFSCVDGVS